MECSPSFNNLFIKYYLFTESFENLLINYLVYKTRTPVTPF